MYHFPRKTGKINYERFRNIITHSLVPQLKNIGFDDMCLQHDSATWRSTREKFDGLARVSSWSVLVTGINRHALAI